MTHTTTDRPTDEMVAFAGRIGVVGVIGIIVVLLIHPFGTTELYDDPGKFIDHVNPFWMAIHFVAAITFAVFPLVFTTWTRTLQPGPAQVVAGWASMLAMAGFALGGLHLIGTDTMTFWAFQDTYEAAGGSEASVIGVDVLLRLHAATLSSWVAVFFLSVPLLGGIAALMAGWGPRWLGWMGIVGGAIQVVALAVTVAEHQWTTLSEQILFRTGATLFILFTLALAMGLRRGAPIGDPAS